MKREFFASLAFLLAFLWTIAADASPVNCRKGQCDLLKNGAYAAVVIGTVDHVGTDGELGSVYQWANSHRYWSKLPKGKPHYLSAANLIAVTPPPKNTSASPCYARRKIRIALAATNREPFQGKPASKSM